MTATASPAASDLGRPVTGPSAVGPDVRRFWRLAWMIAVTDLRLRFFGSVLGYLWQLIRPLLLFGVLFVVFTQVVDLGAGVRFYATALLLGIVLFSFLREGVGGSVSILVDRDTLVRKVQFPRLALPVAVVISAVLNLALNLVPVFVFLFVQGGSPRVKWLWLPVLVGLLAIFVTGLAMLLSAAFVRFRDVGPIWDVVAQALFYGSPIFYPVQTIVGDHAETITRLLLANPFAAVLQQARHVLIDPSHPSAAEAMGGAIWLLVPLAVTAAVFAAGWVVFRRMAPRIAELL